MTRESGRDKIHPCPGILPFGMCSHCSREQLALCSQYYTKVVLVLGKAGSSRIGLNSV